MYSALICESDFCLLVLDPHKIRNQLTQTVIMQACLAKLQSTRIVLSSKRHGPISVL